MAKDEEPELRLNIVENSSIRVLPNENRKTEGTRLIKIKEKVLNTQTDTFND